VLLACAAAALGIGVRTAVAVTESAAIGVSIEAPEDAPGYRPVFSEDRIREWVEGFAGGACDPGAVAEAVGRRYRFLGYVPTIRVSCADAGLTVRIRESSHRIVLIAFDPADLARVGVSPDTDAEERFPLYPVPTGSIRVLLRGLLQTREGDLYNHERYRSDSDALRRLGYAVAFIHGSATDPAAYPRGAYLVQSLRPHRLDEAKGPTQKRSYLGGTGSYAPRAGTAAGLLFQQNGVFGDFDRLSIAPSFNASFGADLAYVTPLLAVRGAPRRLYDLGGSVYTYFTHNRIIDERPTDERRTGGSVNLGVRPLNLGAPHDLRWQVGVRHESVGISEPSLRTNDENLTFLQLSANYEWRHTFRFPTLSLHLAPVFDFSLATAGGQRSFVRPGLDGS